MHRAGQKILRLPAGLAWQARRYFIFLPNDKPSKPNAPRIFPERQTGLACQEIAYFIFEALALRRPVPQILSTSVVSNDCHIITKGLDGLLWRHGLYLLEYSENFQDNFTAQIFRIFQHSPIPSRCPQFIAHNVFNYWLRLFGDKCGE